MPQNVPEELSRTIETLYRSESGRILATLARLLGDLNVAEEAMHEAFAAALDTWPQAGVPDKPRPWLISTGRFKAINGMRQSKSQCINRLKKMPEHSVNSHRRYLIKSCRKTG